MRSSDKDANCDGSLLARLFCAHVRFEIDPILPPALRIRGDDRGSTQREPRGEAQEPKRVCWKRKSLKTMGRQRVANALNCGQGEVHSVKLRFRSQSGANKIVDIVSEHSTRSEAESHFRLRQICLCILKLSRQQALHLFSRLDVRVRLSATGGGAPVRFERWRGAPPADGVSELQREAAAPAPFGCFNIRNRAPGRVDSGPSRLAGNLDMPLSGPRLGDV